MIMQVIQRVAMNKYARMILDAVFPPKCAGCGKIVGRIICGVCLNEISRKAMWPCHKCREPPYLCGCKRIGYVSALVFPYFYDGEKLKKAIFKLKRANLYYINEFFAKGMYNSVKSGDKINLRDIDFIACAPRAVKSVNIYGYNHAESLAKLIAQYSGVKFERAIKCRRLSGLRGYREQKSLGRAERAANVQGKFAVSKKIDVRGKNIIIVDDVATSGATLSECAKVLKEAGAGEIYALCAAAALG